MMDFEQHFVEHGFTKLTWEGPVPNPMPVPNVPYWACRGIRMPWPATVVWVPNYDQRGNSGFMDVQDLDFCLLKDGRWTWECTIDNPYESWSARPMIDYNFMKRVSSPFPDDLLVIPDCPSVLS